MSRTGSEESQKKKSFNILSVLGLIIGLAVGISLSRWGPSDKPKPKPLPSGDAEQQWHYEQDRQDPERIEQVQKIQELLSDQGYDPGAADGQMTAETEAAIRQYQRDQGRQQTGRPTTALLGQLETRPDTDDQTDAAPEPPARGIGLSRNKVRKYYENSTAGAGFNWQKPEPGHPRVRAISIENQSVLDLIGPENDLANTQLTMPLPSERDQEAVLKNVENMTAYLELMAPDAVGWAKSNVRSGT